MSTRTGKERRQEVQAKGIATVTRIVSWEDYPRIPKIFESGRSAPALQKIRDAQDREGRLHENREARLHSPTASNAVQRRFGRGNDRWTTAGRIPLPARRRTEAAFAALLAIHGSMVWDVCQSVLPGSHAAGSSRTINRHGSSLGSHRAFLVQTLIQRRCRNAAMSPAGYRNCRPEVLRVSLLNRLDIFPVF